MYLRLIQCDIDPQGKVSLGISCIVRVTLKDGTYHEVIWIDLGCRLWKY